MTEAPGTPALAAWSRRRRRNVGRIIAWSAAATWMLVFFATAMIVGCWRLVVEKTLPIWMQIQTYLMCRLIVMTNYPGQARKSGRGFRFYLPTDLRDADRGAAVAGGAGLFPFLAIRCLHHD